MSSTQFSCATFASDAGGVEAETLTQRLSWESVGYEHMAMILWPKPIGAVAERLLEIGKPATPALLRALQDPSRGVAAHLVLFKIYNPRKLESGEAPIYEGKNIIGFRHTVAGLTWTTMFLIAPCPEGFTNCEDNFQFADRITGERYEIAPEALESSRRRWCEKVPRRYREACN